MVIAGCAAPDLAIGDWEQAKRLDTASAYSGFLARHAGHPLAAEAQRTLAAAQQREHDEAWSRARGGDEAAIRQYLRDHPQGAHVEEILAMRRASWRNAFRTGAPDDLRRMMKLGSRTGLPPAEERIVLEEAGHALAAAVWREANSPGDAPGRYRDYLDEFPAGEHVDEAKDVLTWVEVERMGTVEAVRAYLEAHPQGRFAEHARTVERQLAEAPLGDEGERATAAAAAVQEIGYQVVKAQFGMDLSLSHENPLRLRFSTAHVGKATIRVGQSDGMSAQFAEMTLALTGPDVDRANERARETGVAQPLENPLGRIESGDLTLAGQFEFGGQVARFLTGGMRVIAKGAPPEVDEGTVCELDQGVRFEFRDGNWHRAGGFPRKFRVE